MLKPDFEKGEFPVTCKSCSVARWRGVPLDILLSRPATVFYCELVDAEELVYQPRGNTTATAMSAENIWALL